MNKSILKKIGVIIIIMVILRISLIVGLHYINIHSSNYIESQNAEVILEEKLDNYLYTVVDIPQNNGDKVFYIKSNNKQEFSLFIDDLTFLHEIYINDKVVSQNINKNDNFYDSDYAYKVFQINNSDYVDNNVKISIVGNQADKTEVYLAKDDIAKDFREIITIIHVVPLVFLIVSTFISLVLYYYNRKEYYFFIFFLIGITSIIKSIVTGNLFVISRLLGITAQYYSFLDNLTSIINTILPIIIMCYLFDFKIKAKHVVIGLSAFFLLGIFQLINFGSLNLYSILFSVTFIIGHTIMILEFMRDKPFSKVIIIINVVYSASAIYYYILILQGIVPSGNIVFFINPAYLGVVIYMSGFLLAILLKHLDKVRMLENNRNEFERVLLLRGISHDLKLPLSVIKLNNQMIEKYNLSDDDIKEYAKTSVEAAQELEKMTENINCYLSLKQVNVEDQTTSVKECFEKMKHYYGLYNSYDKCRFTIEPDDKDCELDINPIQFSRMLYNLVDNAFKYNNGEVKVTVSYKIDKKLIITVEDNGIGMDKEEIHRIFEPFYRTDPSRTKEGLGLGLSVVKGVVDSIGGTVEVESEKGVGTKISICFAPILAYGGCLYDK